MIVLFVSNKSNVVVESFFVSFRHFEAQPPDLKVFDHFALLWPLQNGRFCHFSKSSHFPNMRCFFVAFFAKNNSSKKIIHNTLFA